MSCKYLVLKGCAGLGNRLITLTSAVKYARKTGRTILVDWSDGMFGPVGTNVFPEYFDLLDIEHIDSITPVLDLIGSGATTLPHNLTTEEAQDNIYRHFDTSASLLSSVPAIRAAVSTITKGTLSAVAGMRSWHREPRRSFGYFERIKGVAEGTMFPVGECLPARLDEDIVVFADFRPYIDLSDIFREVRLKPEIEKPFREYAANHNLGSNGIGVHIRATDKQPPSSYGRLLKVLEKHLSEDPRAVVFLSTDNPDIQKRFEEIFGPDRLISYPKTIPSDGFARGLHQWAVGQKDQKLKERMFRESLADMWILGMCHTLYWQGNSSFSLISHLIHQSSGGLSKSWLSL